MRKNILGGNQILKHDERNEKVWENKVEENLTENKAEGQRDGCRKRKKVILYNQSRRPNIQIIEVLGR